MAPETDNAETRRAAIAVAFLGAKRPKLAKMIVNQKTKTSRNGTGMELPAFSNSSNRVASQVDGHVKGLALQRALRFTLGREFLDLVIDSFEGHGRIERRGPALVCRPKPIETRSYHAAQ